MEKWQEKDNCCVSTIFDTSFPKHSIFVVLFNLLSANTLNLDWSQIFVVWKRVNSGATLYAKTTESVEKCAQDFHS